MTNFDKLTYPAFIQQDEEGIFCVYFPTLFFESGWEYPLTRGETKYKAIQNAKKDLAYTLAGILYDNEELPEPLSLNSNDLSKEMELVEIETSLELYAEEIKEHLKGRHWHIDYYNDDDIPIFGAIGFKNEKDMWDIYFEDSLLFTVKLHSEAEEKFNQYAENVLLKKTQ